MKRHSTHIMHWFLDMELLHNDMNKGFHESCLNANLNDGENFLDPTDAQLLNYCAVRNV